MAVTFTCDRCGFRTEQPGPVKRYTLSLTPQPSNGSDRASLPPFPHRSGKSSTPDPSADGAVVSELARTVDLCDKCVERAWRVIGERLFHAER